MTKRISFFVFLIVCATVCLGCLSLPVRYAKAQDDVAENIDLLLREFVSSFPSRQPFSEGEKAAATFIGEKFEQIGLKKIGNYYIHQFNYGDALTQNVLATTDNGAEKYVVIGAHYDNVGINGADGTSDNGGGVATLLALAKKLKTASLNFDVIFAAFGAEEAGLVGSEYFLYETAEKFTDNILCYINLDSIICGDKLYLYSGETKSALSEFTLDKSKTAGGKTINAVPTHFAATKLRTDGLNPYYAAYFSTDALTFQKAGIPFLSFFAGNLDDFYGYAESFDAAKRVMHTSNDKLTYIESKYGDAYKKNMASVFDCVYAALTDTEFVSLAKSTVLPANSTIKKLIPVGATVVLLVITALLCVAYHRELRKKAILDESGVKSFKIFSQSNSDEIFTFLN